MKILKSLRKCLETRKSQFLLFLKTQKSAFLDEPLPNIRIIGRSAENYKASGKRGEGVLCLSLTCILISHSLSSNNYTLYAWDKLSFI